MSESDTILPDEQAQLIPSPGDWELLRSATARLTNIANKDKRLAQMLDGMSNVEVAPYLLRRYAEVQFALDLVLERHRCLLPYIDYCKRYRDAHPPAPPPRA